MKTLHTDFYQITMSFAYLISGKANEKTGFEAFVRHIKPEINKDLNAYIFRGEKEIIAFMEDVRKEIKSPDFIENFKKMILPKINKKVRDKYSKLIDKAYKKIDKEFNYSVAKDGSIVRPYIPVFQYFGPKIFGQLIETMILNMINGKTGAESYCSFNPDVSEDKKVRIKMLAGIIEPDSKIIDYFSELISTAKDFRASTTKLLFEAAFRRAPSYIIAYNASKIAIENGWDATSNTSLFNEIDESFIGGTMAHAFVMSFETEVEAFRVWNEIFPNSTMLIDTYDTIKATHLLIKNNIKPDTVRIDSGDLAQLSFEVRKILDEAGWTDVKIFISGDLTAELLREYEKIGVPFDKCMAGTKYVNIGDAKYTNAGFVYKIVQYTENGVTHYPMKKAEGKTNYPGLKTVEMINGEIIVSIQKNFFGIKEFVSTIETKVIFDIKK
jgi:nicotinate phosphoribosyltransferase